TARATPRHPNSALGGPQNPGDQLQYAPLPRAIPPDNTEGLTALDTERDIPERPELALVEFIRSCPPRQATRHCGHEIPERIVELAPAKLLEHPFNLENVLSHALNSDAFRKKRLELPECGKRRREEDPRRGDAVGHPNQSRIVVQNHGRRYPFQQWGHGIHKQDGGPASEERRVIKDRSKENRKRQEDLDQVLDISKEQTSCSK